MTTESLCPDHGGVSVKSKCKQCKKEYNRRYYQENHDKVLERKRRYYQENHDKVLERKRRYYQENRDKILEEKRRYRQKNRDKIAEMECRYYQENRDKIAEKNRRYRQKNRDKIAEKNRRYYQENRDYLTAKSAAHIKGKNRASQHFVTNSGKPWTPREVAKMHRLRRQGLTNYEVAVELGRSLESVRNKITRENARHYTMHQMRRDKERHGVLPGQPH